MPESLSKHPFVHHQRLDRLSRADLTAYRVHLDNLLRSVAIESAVERRAVETLKRRTRGNWTLGGLGLATLIGGFTAPVDGGALF